MQINRITQIGTMTAIAIFCSVATVRATIVPFTENYTSGASDWRLVDGVTDLTWNAAGGPDGGSYASGAYSFQNQGPDAQSLIIRGQEEFGASGSSGGAFVGNWIADGATGFSVWVRQSTPEPLNYFVRYANPANSPGAASVAFVPVLPNTWTKLSFNVAFGDPSLTLEGPPSAGFFNTVFSNIGHVQFGVITPTALAGDTTSYTFDVDQVSITPEPASLALIGLGACGVLIRRRRTAGV